MTNKVLHKKVEKILHEDVRPFVRAHGGDIKLVEVTKDTVKIEFKGTCSACPVAEMTLRGVVEKAIKSKIPQIKRVEPICQPPSTR